MSLQSGIGIMFGSNIGTTATGWIIALIGFKFNIKIIALFMVGFGGIGSVLTGEGKIRHTFGAIAGFGLIFLGIEGLKESFSTLSQIIDIQELQKYNIFVFLAAGIVLTAIIQSSSASVVIAQGALYSGVISFEHAAVLVIGANVGTTVTVLIGAIGGSSDKKRTAAAHVLFECKHGLYCTCFINTAYMDSNAYRLTRKRRSPRAFSYPLQCHWGTHLVSHDYTAVHVADETF